MSPTWKGANPTRASRLIRGVSGPLIKPASYVTDFGLVHPAYRWLYPFWCYSLLDGDTYEPVTNARHSIGSASFVVGPHGRALDVSAKLGWANMPTSNADLMPLTIFALLKLDVTGSFHKPWGTYEGTTWGGLVFNMLSGGGGFSVTVAGVNDHNALVATNTTDWFWFLGSYDGARIRSYVKNLTTGVGKFADEAETDPMNTAASTWCTAPSGDFNGKLALCGALKGKGLNEGEIRWWGEHDPFGPWRPYRQVPLALQYRYALRGRR